MNADLFRRQVTSTRVATGVKRSDTGAANQRTEQKTRLFEETLKRFENRLTKLDTQAAASKKSALKSAETKDARPRKIVTHASGKPTLPERSAKAPTARSTSNAPAAKRATEVSKLVHARSSNANAQAKRDNRP